MNSATSATIKPGDRKIWTLFLYLFAFLLLVLLYEFYVAPNWEYMGFEVRLNGTKLAIATGIISFFALATPTDAGVRSFFLNLTLTICLLPSMVLYACADKPTLSLLVLLIALAIVYVVSAVPIPRTTLFTIKTKTLMWFLVVLTSTLIASFYLLGGFHNFNLNLALVYEFRTDAAEALPGIFGYLSSTFSKVFIPFGITIALVHRKYALMIFFVGSAVLLYGLTSHKGILLSPLLAVGSFVVLSRDGRYSVVLTLFILLLLFGLFATVMMAFPESSSLWSWYNTLFIRRALMIPALLDYYYINFFTDNPYYYWSSSRLTFGMMPDPYGIVPPKLMGEVYFGSADTSANTGFIGSGYAQAGLPGVIIYAFGVGLLFAIFQAYGTYLGLPFVVAATMGQVLTMIRATDFVTLFLTHGMLISLLLLAVARSPKTERNGPPRRAVPPVSGPSQTS